MVLERSIHEQVTPAEVAEASGVPLVAVDAVLVAQRRAVAICQATNGVIVLSGVTLRHRGDALGQWLADFDASAVTEGTWARVDEELAAAPDAQVGTSLARVVGCPAGLLDGREVWSMADLAPVIALLAERSHGVEPHVTEAVLNAFWDLAEACTETWVWPYDRPAMERDIEDWLEQNLDQLQRFGLTVRLADLASGVASRQWRNADGSSRLDLLLEVTQSGTSTATIGGAEHEVQFEVGDLVVVELKAVALTAADFDQLRRYVGVVQAEVSNGRRVWGFLIGSGWTDSFIAAFEAAPDARLGWLSISEIGFFDDQLGLTGQER